MLLVSWSILSLLCVAAWCLKDKSFANETKLFGATVIVLLVFACIVWGAFSLDESYLHSDSFSSLTPLVIAMLLTGDQNKRTQVSIGSIIRVQCVFALLLFELTSHKYPSLEIGRYRPIISLLYREDVANGILFECVVGGAWAFSLRSVQRFFLRGRLYIVDICIVLLGFPMIASLFGLFSSYPDKLVFDAFLIAPYVLVLLGYSSGLIRHQRTGDIDNTARANAS